MTCLRPIGTWTPNWNFLAYPLTFVLNALANLLGAVPVQCMAKMEKCFCDSRCLEQAYLSISVGSCIARACESTQLAVSPGSSILPSLDDHPSYIYVPVHVSLSIDFILQDKDHICPMDHMSSH